MKEYPLYKYRYYSNGDGKVIAASTYAGKIVRGVAQCDPNDEFDYQTGKKLAALRCALKIADKRENRARNKYWEAIDELNDAIEHFEDMEHYFYDSCDAADKAYEDLEEFLKSI